MKKEIDTFAKTCIKSKLTCKPVKQACERYISDLSRKDLVFDTDAAEISINFVESLTHFEGDLKQQQIELPMWQKFILWNVFGFKNRATGYRKYTKTYIEIPRKNTKTYLAAQVALICLVLEDAPEVYTAATTKDQASICYRTARDLSQASYLRDKYIKKTQYQMYRMDGKGNTLSGFMRALSSDSDTLDGLRPACAVIDEYHAHKTDEVYNVLRSGMGAYNEPLLFTITTAGFNKNGPCYALRKYCLDLLSGRIEDDALFAMIYTLDEKDKWDNPKTWAKANPNLGISVREQFLLDELKEAKADPSKEVNFKTKYLNIWTDTAQTWISDADYMAGGSEFDEAELLGRECVGGLDLSKSHDFSVLVLHFKMDDGTTRQLYYYWLPQSRLDKRAQYTQQLVGWAMQGYIHVTEGNVIDHQYIRNKINELRTKFVLLSIAYDQAFGITLVTELMQDGVDMSPFNQSVVHMSAPTSEYGRLLLEKKLNHGNNPVQRWMMSNILIRTDANGNIKINKAKATDSVDGPVASVMAVGEQIRQDNNGPKKSVYETRGILSI